MIMPRDSEATFLEQAQTTMETMEELMLPEPDLSPLLLSPEWLD